MSLLERFPHKCTAKRRTRTSDGMGGFIDTFSTVVFADKACWRQKATDRQVDYWQQKSMDVTHRVFFAEDPGLDSDCILEDSTYQYNVLSTADPDDSAGLGVLWRVMVAKVDKIP